MRSGCWLFAAVSILLSFRCHSLEPRPFVLDHTQVIDFHSQANGKDYEIYVRLPDAYEQNPNKKYPLLVVTDGYYAFPLISAINWRMSERHKEYQRFILVGISYSKGDNIDASRTRDFTPAGSVQDKKLSQGDAARYITFLGNEVLPWLLSHYRIDNAKKIFAGHSYGGLLATCILFTKPELFNYYLIGSPSLGYQDKFVFKQEVVYAKEHRNLSAKIFMATGERELELIEQMIAFEKALKSRQYPGLQITAKVLADEGHFSGYPAFITQGLLWALPSEK